MEFKISVEDQGGAGQAPPPPEKGMARFYHGGNIEEAGPRWLTPELSYARGYAEKSGGQVHYVDIPETSSHLKKAFDDLGMNIKAPYESFEAPADIASQLQRYEEMGEAAGKEIAKEILPALEELTIQGREPGDILPPLEELRPRDLPPTEIAARAQHMRYKQAKFETYSEQTEAPPVRAGAMAEEGAAAAEGAEGGALVEAGAAAGAGPAAAAVAVIAAAAQATAKAFEFARHGARFLGDELTMVAQNDYIGAFTHGLDVAAKGLETIPVVGKAASEAFKFVAESVNQFERVVESFIARGQELSRFSPELMGANIRAQIRSFQADLREADTLGPELARLTDNWSEFMTELRDILLPLKEAVVTILADMAEWLKNNIGEIKMTVAEMATFVKLLPELIQALTPFSGVSIQDYVKDFQKQVDKIYADMNRPKHLQRYNIEDLFKILPFQAVGDDAAREVGSENALFPNDLLPI